MTKPKVYIVVLNYNSWKETVECIESLFKLEFSNAKIVLVDNNSTDDSIVRLKEWMIGSGDFKVERNPLLSDLSFPEKAKPLSYVLNPADTEMQTQVDIVFLTSETNLGYAGGNNLGIRYGLSENDADFFWVLNNDTVVPPDSLNQLIACFRQLEQAGTNPGILGSKLRFYDEPDVLQGVGCVFNKYTAKIRQIGTFETDRGQYDADPVKVDFVIGASLFVSRELVEKAGTMSEEYFLYNEEVDWCYKAKEKGFSVSYAPKSVVYHKQGASTKNLVRDRKKNINAMFYQFRNIILFYRKFFPALLFIPMVVVTLRILKFTVNVDRKFLSLLIPVLTQQKRYVGKSTVVK